MTKVLSHKKKIITHLGQLNGATILDYGCGRGDFIELLLSSDEKPQQIYAVDSSLEMITHIEQFFDAAIKIGLVVPKICKSPKELTGLSFDKIICHNVLECVDDKLDFINSFAPILADDGTFIISHHDFDSAIYNSSFKELTRELIHEFADTQQEWQDYADGQMGRKIPGLVASSVFKDRFTFETWRIVEREFKPGTYGFLMAKMIMDIVKDSYDPKALELWVRDLEEAEKQQQYYFIIDLVVAVLKNVK